jgi:hypothetical protein
LGLSGDAERERYRNEQGERKELLHRLPPKNY